MCRIFSLLTVLSRVQLTTLVCSSFTTYRQVYNSTHCIYTCLWPPLTYTIILLVYWASYSLFSYWFFSSFSRCCSHWTFFVKLPNRQCPTFSLRSVSAPYTHSTPWLSLPLVSECIYVLAYEHNDYFSTCTLFLRKANFSAYMYDVVAGVGGVCGYIKAFRHCPILASKEKMLRVLMSISRIKSVYMHVQVHVLWVKLFLPLLSSLAP